MFSGASRSYSLRTMLPAIVALFLGVVPAFAADRPARAAARPIRIGLTLGLTGRYAQLAGYQEKGYRLWTADVNKRGGILGRPVELVLLDDKSDPAAAVDLYRKLITADRVDLIFSPFSSDITEAILPLTLKQGYPVIVAGASADGLWEQGYNHIFGLFVPASRFAVGFLEMLVEKDLERIAVFSDDSLFSRNLAEGVRKWSTPLGLKIVLNERIAKGSGQFDSLVARARDGGAQVIILASYLEDAVALRRAFTVAGWMPRAYYVPVGPGTTEYRKALGKDAENVFTTSQWEFYRKHRSRPRDEFREAYQTAYGQDPSYFAATAYAAGQVLESAVLQAGSLDRRAIRSRLAALDMTTVIGRYGVDSTGMQIRQFNLIIQIQKGRLEVVWPPGSRTAEARFP